MFFFNFFAEKDRHQSQVKNSKIFKNVKKNNFDDLSRKQEDESVDSFYQMEFMLKRQSTCFFYTYSACYFDKIMKKNNALTKLHQNNFAFHFINEE
jgi:hypothetical protein